MGSDGQCSCREEYEMKIGITKNTSNEEKFRKYESWLLKFNPAIEFLELTYAENQPSEIDTCDGLLLTGGGDVHPKFYHRADELSKTREVDERRDEFEFEVIDRAFAKNMPVLGICRGLQSINVHRGGTLHVDLEADGFSRHAELDRAENRHRVEFERQSLIGNIAGKEFGKVNSSHHQAANVPGKGLMVSARSSDGVIEAMEWAERNEKPFLLLVQWHPERMKDTFNPLVENVGRIFLEEVKKHQKEK